MNIRDDRAHLAASMYYEQGLTMSSVARRLGVSRSSVSRLLAHARSAGIVTISVSPPQRESDTLSSQFSRLFDVNAVVVPTLEVDTPVARLSTVASVAARRLTEMMEPNMMLGVAWGNTTSAISEHLRPAPRPGSTVVQLNGAANALGIGTLYADSIVSAFAHAFDSRTIHFPVPAFFDYPESREALERESSVRRVREATASCDIAVFGVGAMDPAMPSHVYSGEFLDPDEWARASADGVVGDVSTVLLREDGTYDMDLNARASGPSPELLKQIPRRLGVVAGPAKAPALLAALRAGVITDLVVDSTTAMTTLRRLTS